jgi:hypothetical protein
MYFFFPETSGRTLEEIAVVFDGEAAAITTTVNEKTMHPEVLHHEVAGEKA